MPSPTPTIDYLEAQSSTAPEVYYPVLRQDGGTDKEVQSAVTTSRLRGTIFGLKRNIFWILLIVALIVIIAIAGGVGGSLASKRSKDGTGSSSSGEPCQLPIFTYLHELPSMIQRLLLQLPQV